MKQAISKPTNFLSTPLIRRALAFVLVFLLISGLLGPQIISGGILYKYHFDIYGGLGKAVLFGIIALAILISRQKKNLPVGRWNVANILWFLLCALSIVIAEVGINHIERLAHSSIWPAVTHVSLLASVLLALFGCFSLSTVISFIRTYKRELAASVALAAAFYLMLLTVYVLWKVLAAAVLHSVKWLLNTAGIHAAIFPPRTLFLDKFGIEVAQYCSGIESIALFTGLYAIIGTLDWHKFNHRKLFIAFPLALLVLFGLNILRVFVLILAGYYISPQIAFSLFHTYAGMIFFIVYAGVFWTLFYKRLIRRPLQKSHKQIFTKHI